MVAIEPGKFELTPDVHKQMVKNLVKRTKAFTPESVKAGGSWYPEAKLDAESIGSDIGRDTTAGGAILSKLSSKTFWGANRLMGQQILHLNDRQASLITRASTEKDSDKRASLMDRANLTGTPLKPQGTKEIAAALSVKSGEAEDPMSIFKARANISQKTPDFATAVSTGGKTTAAPIDTHAYDAALDSYQVPYGTGNEHMKKPNVYHFIQNAYAQAHQVSLEKGLIPKDTSLADYQAMHWVHHLNNKALTNENSGRTQKTNVTKLQNYLTRSPHLDPSAKGLPPITVNVGGVSQVITAPSRRSHFDLGAGGQ
jgi:hypothetical protein